MDFPVLEILYVSSDGGNAACGTSWMCDLQGMEREIRKYGMVLIDLVAFIDI